MNTYGIKNEAGELVGKIELKDDPESIWDFALTPIVKMDRDDASVEPELAGFMTSKRTELDTRERSSEHPFDHIDADVHGSAVPGSGLAQPDGERGESADSYDQAAGGEDEDRSSMAEGAEPDPA